MRHEGTKVYKGFVAKCDLDDNFAVVNVYTFLDIQVGPFQCAPESLPHGEVLAVARGVSGETMAKSVELNGDSRVSEDNEDRGNTCITIRAFHSISVMHGGNKNNFLFIFNSQSIQFHFVQLCY